MRIVIINKKIVFRQFLLAIIYKIVLDISYVVCEEPYFGYLGIECNFHMLKWIIAWIIYLLGFALLKSNKNEIINIFSYVMFFLSIAPFLSLYQFSSTCQLWMVILQVSALVFIDFVAKKCTFNIKCLKVHSYKERSVRVLGWIFLTILFLYLIGKYGLPNLDFLGMDTISEVRKTANFSTVDSILTGISGKIICPLYIMICWKERKILKFAYAMIIQIYMYSISGFKTFLFILVVLLGLNIVKKFDLKKIIILGLTGVLILVGLLAKIFGKLMPYALFGDRVIFFPAIIKWAFFDYFSQNPFVYFSQNSFAKILKIKGSYDKNVFNIIGENYFNKPSMWTNTGIFADAYSNLGVVGVFIISFLMILILIFISKRMNYFNGDIKNAMMTVYIIYFISLNDGAFLYTMVSGGMMVVVMISTLIDFSEDKDIC